MQSRWKVEYYHKQLKGFLRGQYHMDSSLFVVGTFEEHLLSKWEMPLEDKDLESFDALQMIFKRKVRLRKSLFVILEGLNFLYFLPSSFYLHRKATQRHCGRDLCTYEEACKEDYGGTLGQKSPHTNGGV